MTETDRLIQRFLDQELSSDERITFLQRLARERDLHQRVLDLEQVVAEVQRLPRPVVPPGFTAAVMRRVTTRSPSFLQQVRTVLWVPHTLQWNWAGAMAAASIVFVLAWGLIRGLSPMAITVPQPERFASQPAVERVLVRLVVLQPGAKSVQVAGDFNGWNPARTPLQALSGGAWAVTLPLKPGRYEYMYVVDGQQWVADPLATEQTDDGFGSQNAVLEIRPAAETLL